MSHAASHGGVHRANRPVSQLVHASRHVDGRASGNPWGLCDRCFRVGSHRGACRSAPARPNTLDQAALTSIILGVAARGAGTLTSSMPFTHLASTWAASTPSGSVTLRWKAPYATAASSP